MPKEVQLDVSLSLVEDGGDGGGDGGTEVGNVIAWVTDDGNQALSGATLSVVSDDGSVTRAADSNMTGRAIIEGVPVQVYDVTITADYPDDDQQTYETFETRIGPGTDHNFTRSE